MRPCFLQPVGMSLTLLRRPVFVVPVSFCYQPASLYYNGAWLSVLADTNLTCSDDIEIEVEGTPW